MKKEKIRSFTDLIVWQKSHSLVLEVYKLTKRFPSDEKFGLTNQLRRAAVSITSNIAEGFSRKSYKEKIQFYYTSLGSLSEVQNQLLISKDLKYLNMTEFDRLFELTVEISKMLSVLIKKSKVKQLNSRI